MPTEALTTQQIIASSETVGDIVIDWDVPIAMDDGIVIRADVFRPRGEDRYPALFSYGPYAKGLTWDAGVYGDQWRALTTEHPEVLEGSTGRYLSWEVADPEKWVPDGYALVRADSRGAGRSQGFLDPFGPREHEDMYECIEWTAQQPWCTGRVGMAGISYYAITQWYAAARQPPHLAAICPWEGAGDFYRECTHHGGIPGTFFGNWVDWQLEYVQHGRGERGLRNPNNGELVSGPPTLSDEELAANRREVRELMRTTPLISEFHRERSVDWTNVRVPLLSCGSWGGHGLHLRGNLTGFEEAASRHRWLEIHGLEHWTHFYTDYGRQLQKRFFDHFLKGDNNGWDDQPRVQLQIRHIDGFVQRAEQEWPLARTRWTKLFLHPDESALRHAPGPETRQASFRALEEHLAFHTAPFGHETEITGPVAAKLFVSSSTSDADLFVVVHLFDPDGREVLFAGSVEPRAPIAQGWLRASHRALDPDLTRPYRPYHPHDRIEPLEPGAVYELDVEIWPTSIVIPAGYTLGLSVRGTDYEHPVEQDTGVSTVQLTMRGSGPFLHDDPGSRPASVYGGTTTVYGGGENASYLLVPVIPRAA